MNKRVDHFKIQEQTRVTTSAEIISCGTFLPNNVIKSDDLLSEIDSHKRYGIPETFISKKVGIIERRFADEGETPSSMAAKAAQQALDEAPQINPDKIQKLVFCGISKDQEEPATAHNVNKTLGLNAMDTYDTTDACYGFIRGMEDCARSIRLGEIDYAMVVTGEMPSKVIKHYVDRMKAGVDKAYVKKWIGFLTAGDAAGAVIMGAAEEGSGRGFGRFTSQTNSEHADKCFYRHESDGSITGQMLMGELNAFGKEIADDVIFKITSNPSWERPDYTITHQTGKGTFDILAAYQLTPRERMIKSYDVLGNITTATFPISYQQLIKDIAPPQGTRVACLQAGSGLVFGHFDIVL